MGATFLMIGIIVMSTAHIMNVFIGMLVQITSPPPFSEKHSANSSAKVALLSLELVLASIQVRVDSLALRLSLASRQLLSFTFRHHGLIGLAYQDARLSAKSTTLVDS